MEINMEQYTNFYVNFITLTGCQYHHWKHGNNYLIHYQPRFKTAMSLFGEIRLQ